MLIEAFLEYLQYEKKYSEHTIKSYKTDLVAFSKFSKDTLGEEQLKNINYHQIRSWIVFLVNHGLSNRTVNRKITSLNSFYKFLQKIKEIELNPLAKHKALKYQKKIQTPFDKEEVAQVLNLVEEDVSFESVRNRLIVELLYSTGIRRIELINIKEKDIDFNKKEIKILGKRNKERLVVLLPSVLQTLNQYLTLKRSYEVLGEEALLITKKGAKIYETLVYRIINLYFSRVSVKAKKSPHILRHAFATHLLNNGASLNSVKELLGHSSLAATQVYTHNSLEQIKKVYNKAHPRGSNKKNE